MKEFGKKLITELVVSLLAFLGIRAVENALDGKDFRGRKKVDPFNEEQINLDSNEFEVK